MNTSKLKFVIVPLLAIIVSLIVVFFRYGDDPAKGLVEAKAFLGSIEQIVSTVGTVSPQNRLEIKPPINGRIEKILVREGMNVKIGDILAFMSSTDRATLVDAARLKGDDELRYWQNAYKETQLIAPIDGVIIVRNVEPGQTITTNDAVLVISDRLIVQADVDETDIGDVAVGQKTVIGLDAYPNISVDSTVDHISYESQIINNVTIYKVDILPETVPDIFRSGMSANVKIIVKKKDDVLLIPTNALINENGFFFVLTRKTATGSAEKTPVVTGMSKQKHVEIISGLEEGAVVFFPEDEDIIIKKSEGTNPLMPSRSRGKK